MSTAVRDGFRALAHAIRAIPGRDFGLYPYTVAIIQGSWSGTYTGRGSKTESETAITEADGQPPKVRELNGEELALGELDAGSVAIGPITPAFAGGGTDLSDLLPAVTSGQTVHVRLTGPKYPNGAKFRIAEVKTDRALHYMLTAVPVSTEV